MEAHNPSHKKSMIREDNIIAFWTVFGFFIGLMIAFFKFIDPFEILLSVLVTTLFFYLMAHVSVALYVRYMEFGKIHFEKEDFEKRLDFYFQQLLLREKEIEADRRFIDEIADETEMMRAKEEKARAKR